MSINPSSYGISHYPEMKPSNHAHTKYRILLIWNSTRQNDGHRRGSWNRAELSRAPWCRRAAGAYVRHARTHIRTHARTHDIHIRTHTHTHTHTHTRTPAGGRRHSGTQSYCDACQGTRAAASGRMTWLGVAHSGPAGGGAGRQVRPRSCMTPNEPPPLR